MQPVQLFEAIIAEPQDSQVPLLHSLMKELPPTTMLDVLGDRTPLMMAAQHGCVEVMAYLLREACADPNTRAPGDGFTALHCAAAGGSARTLEAIGLLLSCGGDRDVLDDAGRRPLDVLPALVGQHEQEQASTVPDVLVLDQPELDFDKPEFKTADFRMFSFKVADCPLLCVHDWTECPYAHPGEKARRRDPQRFKYCGAACPDFRKGSCKRGDGCEYAHGVFECWLHPSRYRTQVCKDGSACNRKVCFFAHSMDELRQSPEEDEEAAAALASATSSPGACDSGALPAPAGHSSAHPSHHDLMSQCFSPSGSDLSPLLLQGLGEVNSTPASAYSSAGPSSPRAIPVPPAPPPAAATPSATPPGSPTPLAASAAIAVAAASAAQQAQPGLDANGLPVLPDGLRAIHDAAAAAAAAAAAGEHVSGGQLSLLLNGKAPGNPNGGGGAKSQAAALALGRLADPNLTEDERLAHAVTSLSGMLAQIQVNQAQQQHLAAQCAAGMMPGAQLQHLQQQAGAHHPLHNGGGSGGYPLAHLHAGGGGGGAGHYRERRLSGGAPYTPPLSPNRSGYSTPPTAAQMRAGGMARSPPLSASHFHGMANNARGSAGPSPPASPPITPPMSPRASRAPSLAHMLCPAAADAGHGFGSMQDMAEMRGLVGQHQQHLLSPSHLQQQQQRSQGSPLLYLPPQAPPPPPPPPAPPPSVQQRHLALSALAAAVQLEQQQLMAQWSDLTLAAGQMPVPQQQAGRSMVGGGGPQQWHNEQRAPTMQVSSFPQQQPAYPQQSASYQQQSAFQPAPLPFFAASHPRMSVSAPSSPPAPSHGFLGGGTLSSHGGNMSSHGGNMSSHGPPPPPPPLQHPGWASAPLSPRLHTPQSSSDGSAFWGDGGSQTATCL